jgi:hypothetical protein
MARVSSFRYASLPSYLGAMTTAPIRAATSLPARTFALEIEIPSSAVLWPGVTIAIEGTCMHLVLASGSPVVAWIVTSVNCLALVTLWRAYRAARRARLIVSDTHVEVRAWSGFRCRFVRSLVERVDAATSETVPDPAPDYLDLGRFEPNVILVLRQATEVYFAPGIQKAISRIGLRVADAAGVVALLR